MAAVSTVTAVDLGDKLFRTYTRYVDLPMDSADIAKGGWGQINGSTCDPDYGIAYGNMTEDRHSPFVVYFTPAGKVAGVSVDVYGAAPPSKMIDAGYFTQVANEHYRIHVSFRVDPCTSAGGSTLGDMLVVNRRGANVSLPLTRPAAEQQGWFGGSCFYGMGQHYFYDVATHPEMSWQAENLLPVITMYNNKDEIQAFFFASWTIQNEVFDTNDWEPIPLPNYLMCKNTCSKDCTFHGTSAWSTLHVYLKDLDQATCHNGTCTTACCPA